MIHLPGGVFAMGSEAFYPEEAPVRQVSVDPFWIDEAPVTNAEFAHFVAQTGYVTFAEIAPDPWQYPGMLPELAFPGSLVFEPTPGPVELWLGLLVGVSPWRQAGTRRSGPGSSIAGIEDHPVVHVTHADAEAYAPLGWQAAADRS